MPLCPQSGRLDWETGCQHLSWQSTHCNQLQTRYTKIPRGPFAENTVCSIKQLPAHREPCCMHVTTTCLCELLDSTLHASLTSFLLADISTAADLANCIFGADLLNAALSLHSTYAAHHQITERVELVKNHWPKYSMTLMFRSLGMFSKAVRDPFCCYLKKAPCFKGAKVKKYAFPIPSLLPQVQAGTGNQPHSTVLSTILG